MKKVLVIVFFFFSLAASTLGQTWRTCIRVIDGDTIVLDEDETVRLIGVDTPESKDPRKGVQYFAEEASQFLRRLIEGKPIRLEYDQERVDKYGRTLAYLYQEHGTCVNSEIIRQGFGMAYIKYPFKYLEEYLRIEREARINAVGLWGSPIPAAPESADSSANVTPIVPLMQGLPGPAANTAPEKQVFVYASRTGKKYHNYECRYVKDKIVDTYSLEMATEKGFEPCSVCKPPVLQVATQAHPSSSSTSAKNSPKTKETTSSGRTILTGPRGGKYYINSKGKKVYIKKK